MKAMLDLAPSVWAAQLRALQADFDTMRILARETESDGHIGLLASAAFSCRARELQGRAVRLFGQVAHTMRGIEGTRNVRSRLLQTSQQLAALFDGGTPATHMHRRCAAAAQQQRPTVKDLLYTVDGLSPFYDGMSLHDRVLSVSRAAESALQDWRSPVPPMRVRHLAGPEAVEAPWARVEQSLAPTPWPVREHVAEEAQPNRPLFQLDTGYGATRLRR